MRFKRRRDATEPNDPKSIGISRLVLVVGLTVTAAVALLQQSNVKNTRQLTFDAAAAKIQEQLVTAVNTLVQGFESDLNFVRATHPGPVDEFRAYLSAGGSEVRSGDPGFILIESMPTSELEALVDRERNLGNADFTPTLLAPQATEHYLLTRTTYQSEVLGVPLDGLDLSVMLDNPLVSTVVTRRGLGMLVLPSDEITALLTAGDAASADVPPEFVAFLTAELFGNDGKFIGYAFETQDIPDLLGSIEASEMQGLSAQLYVGSITKSIDDRLSPNAPSIDDAGLRATREVTTATLDWRIEVWADDDYGASTGLVFDQAWVWIVGVLTTTAIYAASMRRQRTRNRLSQAHFELAHAQTLARTDALTGLLNRNGLINAARNVSSDAPATVFFIDLDGFKAVNDTGGHALGDQVLRSVAVQLRSIFRAEDLVGRLGGDEFLVFTEQPDTDGYVASVCERITEAISGIDERVSCSLGVASRPAFDGTDIKELVRVADAAMYEAKRSGGDRYEVSAANPK